MRIKPAVASVVGPVNETRWGQILMLPHAYGVVEVSRPSGGALQRGIQILAKLTSLLGESPGSLHVAEKIVEEVSGEDLVSFMLLVPVGTTVYVVLRGKGTAYIKRGQELAMLTKDSGSISGEVKQGDTLLLATQSLTSVLPQNELATIFDHLSPQEAAEKLTLLLHEKVDGAGSAALIFQVSELISVEDEPLPAGEVGQDTVIAQPSRSSPRQFLTRVRSFRPRHFARAQSFVRRRFSQGRKPKLIAALAAGLFILFGISVVIGLNKQAHNTKAQAVEVAVSNAQRVFDEGSALLPLNPVKGRERLAAAKAMLEPLIKTTSPRSKEGKKLSALYQQISDNLTQALAVTRGEPQLFYDVSLVKKGALAGNFALSGDTIAIADSAVHTVYALSLSSKNGQVIAGGDGFDGTMLTGTTGDMMYVLTNTGIHVVTIKSKATKQSVIKKDDQWGTIASMVAFGGNIYLLDTGKGRIWKYIATDAGFTDRREYLNPDTLPDLTHATSMAIDGSVWAGTTNGKIFRFTQGKENTFTPQGVDPEFGSNLLVYTSDDVKNVYVADTGKKRVVVLDKDGMYISQYVWEGNLTPTQLVVSEEAKKILLLADGKMYSLDLK